MKHQEMNTRDKVITTVALSLAAPLLAATFLPLALVAPLSLVVPFIALSHLEGCVSEGHAA